MNITDFDFMLPKDRIARFPRSKRDQAKLMVVERKSGNIYHHKFCELNTLVEETDVLVINDSGVIPAKMFGEIKERKVEFTIVRRLSETRVEVLAKPAKVFRLNSEIKIGSRLYARVYQISTKGRRKLEFNQPVNAVLKEGFAPLPPYIKRGYQEARRYRRYDLERYQTIYASRAGSIAAPTAGLHFSQDLFKKLNNKILPVTLEVGEATFQSIATQDIRDHKMGKEKIRIITDVQNQIRKLKRDHKLIAVGTTSVRALETFARRENGNEEFISEIFIYPGFSFKLVDKLITNFHLPRSGLFILVSAFAGLELMQKSYKIAIEKNYRFFSYGDAMFII